MQIQILFDADADPDQTFHPDGVLDLYPDPGNQQKAQTLEEVLK
jgi:hypothetical protein